MCFCRERYELPIIRHTCRMTTVTLMHAHQGVISGGQPLHSREEGSDVMPIVYIIILCELHCCSQECNPIRWPHHRYYYPARQTKLMHQSDWSVGDPIYNSYIRGTRDVWDLFHWSTRAWNGQRDKWIKCHASQIQKDAQPSPQPNCHDYSCNTLNLLETLSNGLYTS